MSRTGCLRIAATATLFGLLSASFVLIGFVKAAHNFPQPAVNGPHGADRFPTARSNHLALLIAT